MKTSVPGNKRHVLPAVLSLVFICVSMFVTFKTTKLTQLKLNVRQLEKFQEKLERDNQQEIRNIKE